jgi:hypothetical protein
MLRVSFVGTIIAGMWQTLSTQNLVATEALNSSATRGNGPFSLCCPAVVERFSLCGLQQSDPVGLKRGKF